MNVQELYNSKLTTAENIALGVEPGWEVASDIAAAMPLDIMNALGKASIEDKIGKIKYHMFLDIQPNGMLAPGAEKNIEVVSWFAGGGLRKALNSGRADFMAGTYAELPGTIEEYINLDAIYLSVSPMDKHGYFTCGLCGSACEALLKKGKRIFLEVNKNTPRTIYSPLIHISQVEALCESDRPLPIMPPTKIDDISAKIGAYIAEAIPDRATIQLGIGAVPDAVGLALKDKKDLGIHTELFTDSMVELIECGAVTNAYKPIYKGKSVATLAFGSQRMYDFIDDNPAFVMLPVTQVNDPNIIALHDNFISVNAALEVDFHGQVCAETIGTKIVSGSGGQVDYVRGANMSKGGKSFIAFPSTAAGGTVSRIRPMLSEGAVVTTGKNDVDYIVTEYGMAKLRGRTLGERTKALISVAHPDFREELLFEAKKRNILI